MRRKPLTIPEFVVSFAARRQLGFGGRRENLSPITALSPGQSIASHLAKSFQHIGILAHQEQQRGGLRIGFGPPLFPFFQSPFVDSKLTGKGCPRTAQLCARSRPHIRRPTNPAGPAQGKINSINSILVNGNNRSNLCAVSR